MAMQAARAIVLDNLEDGDEIEVEASADASNIQFRKGELMFNLTAHEFSELVYAMVCVDNYVDRINLRRRAH
jgi:hypothetical protein